MSWFYVILLKALDCNILKLAALILSKFILTYWDMLPAILNLSVDFYKIEEKDEAFNNMT